MAITAEQFGKAIVASGLLSADEVKTVWAALPADAKPKDGDRFAQALLEQGKLTKFQAQEILAGRGAALTMGDYVLLAEIGAGGMGKVYKAQHRRMKRVVALKVMSSAAMQDEAAVKRFQREVVAAARLEHPNIVTAYDSGEAGKVKYLVMQFVDGGDLSDLVKTQGPLPIETAVHYVIQAARGLAFAHAAGVVHRDIKPANLLLDKKGVVKILDMGLARIEDGDGLTATEQVMGTVDYMSPEQAAETKNADARSDIYSLGCTLWYLLSGKKLYDGDTMISRLMKHRDAELPSLVKTRDDASWPLEQALHKMIAKRPQDRHQTMDEVVAALEPFADASALGGHGGMGSSIGGGKSQSAELASFMQAMAGGAAKPSTSSPSLAAQTSKPATSAQVDKTAAFSSADVGTDPKSALHTRGLPQPSAPRKKNPPMKLIAAGVLGVALLSVAGVIITVRDKEGNVVAEVNAPTGTSVEVKPTPAPVTPPAVPAGSPQAKTLSIAELLESPDYMWSAPENLGLGVNSTHAEAKPTLTADELRLVFRCDVGASGNVSSLWECKRATIDEPFGPRVRVIGSAYEDEPFLSADGLTLLYDTHAAPAGRIKEDLRIRRRSALDAPWGQAFSVPMSEDGDEQTPWLSPDGLTLIYASPRAGGLGLRDLWFCRRAAPDAPFGSPNSFRCGANSPASESAPQLLSDGRTVLFSRDGKPHLTFTSATGVLSALPLYGVPDDVREPWLSADGRRLYFHSGRPGGQGNDDLWMMRLVPKGSSPSAPPAAPTVVTIDVAAEGLEPRWPFDPQEGEYGWSDPKNLGPPVNGPNIQKHPTLTADQLCLIVGDHRDSAGKSDLVEYRRKSVDEPWGDGVRLAGSDYENYPSLSADGLTLLYNSADAKAPNAQGKEDIYERRRADRDAPWGPPQNLGPQINTAGDESGASLSPDGLMLVFGSNRPDTRGISDLYIARRAKAGDAWGEVQNLGDEINDAGPQEYARFAGDGSHLLFNRGSELKVARRDDAGRWSQVPLPRVEITWRAAWPTPDGRTMYFHSDTLADGSAMADVWVTRRALKPGSAVPSVAPPSAGVVFLDDLTPLDQSGGSSCVEGHGSGYKGNTKFKWQGVVPAHSLFMHPSFAPVAKAAHVVYQLPQGCETFQAEIGLVTERPRSPLTFRVVGDGKPLFEKKGVVRHQAGEPISVSVRGVATLQLEVVPEGPDAANCHGVWLNPRLTSASHGPSQIERLFSADYEWSEPESLGPTVNAAKLVALPTLSDDQLCLITFQYGKSGEKTNGLREYRRQSVDAPWSDVVQVADTSEGYPSLSGDGLMLLTVTESVNPADGKKHRDLMLRTRVARNAPWGPRMLIASLNSKGNEYRPVIASDGLSLVFASNRAGGIGEMDLWISRRDDVKADWQPPVNLGKKVNTSKDEYASQFLADGKTILVNRDGDLFFAAPDVQGNYDLRPVPLPTNVKTNKCWLSPDGATLYLDYYHSIGEGGNEIRLMRRVPKPTAAAPVAPGEVEFNARRYRFVAKPGHSFSYVNGKAGELGGRLAEVPDQATFDFVQKLIPADAPLDARVWLGGKRVLHEKNWQWLSGRPWGFTAWDAQEPNHPDYSNANLQLRKTADGVKWVDESYAYTENVIGFIVEWDMLGPSLGASEISAPPLAKAPFDAAQAKAHQATWAKHLGIEVETQNSVGMKMVLIPPGEFLMGSTDEQVAAALKVAVENKADATAVSRIDKAERPQHKVVITKPFLLSATEVTIGQFKKFVEGSKYATESERYGFGESSGTVMDDKVKDAQKQKNWRSPGYAVTDDSPVAQITWNDAAAYCRWLSTQEKTTYRLPTEAEWEYACRAGTTTQFSFGDDSNESSQYGWFRENARATAHPVGTKLPNGFGLFDMHGNLYEWCGDFYEEKWYEQSLASNTPSSDPTGPSAGSWRAIRGGHCSNVASYSRSAYRFRDPPTNRTYYIGFRCVQELDVTVTTASIPTAPAGSATTSAKLFMHDPAFPQWMVQVQAMPAEQQLEAVSKKLVELNPGFDGKLLGGDGLFKIEDAPRIENGVVTHVRLHTDAVTDISPIRALSGLESFCYCGTKSFPESKFNDLLPLNGMMSLKIVNIGETEVADLTPLAGISLEYLILTGNSSINDLTPLQSMTSLKLLWVGYHNISTLEPLKGLTLTELNIRNTKVSDLSPLTDMTSLAQLNMMDTPIADLSPLAGCKNLTKLLAKKTQVTAAQVAALQKALPNCKIEWGDPKATPSQPAASGTK